MESQTVDFGIDLGTTNSAIARSTPKGIKVIKSRLQSDTIPSAVARSRSGQTMVGEDALAKRDQGTASQFKRLMGGSSRIAMMDGSEASPEELSAEVLKELKASVQLRFDLDIRHVVITVPAMFLQPQCEATHRAARLAGLNAVALVQEPIAAATAYLNDDPEEGDYLVYDLGGGTFDVSLVRLADNQMTVIGHGGDNYLGGADFDIKIADHITQQVERGHGVQTHLTQEKNRFQLLQLCEAAKKQLSFQPEASIDLSDLKLPVNHFRLTRDLLEDLIADMITRTIRLSRERIEEADLDPTAIKSVLLVGGPTQMAYVRRRLKEELGIPISVEQDPMTVVAIGAAITASTLLKPDRASTKSVSSEERLVVIEPHYDPVSSELSTTLAGKITDPPNFAGEVRVTRSKGDWETGWIPLKNGAFACDVVLDIGTTTEFRFSVRDGAGRLYEANPPSITIRNGIAPATPITPYNYGVALADGTFDVIIPNKQPLPNYGTSRYSAASDVLAGSPDELYIPFLEGLSSVAEDNVEVGQLRIRGTDLPRNLREGERIDVRINQDGSRRLTARVSIPLFDLEYTVELQSLMVAPNVEDLRASFREAEKVRGQVQSVILPDDENTFRDVSRDMEQLEAQVKSLQEKDTAGAEKVAKKLADVKAQLRPMEANYRILSLHRVAKSVSEQAENIARDFENRLDETSAQELSEEADKSLRIGDEMGLKAVKERADHLFWKYYSRTRECWADWVQFLREQRRFASNASSYDDALKRAHDCLERDDYEGVRVNGAEARQYLPIEKASEKRFSEAGLRA